MSRISTALAATAMAVATAGGGLLIAAASAVPAGASATGTPAAPPPGHTITIHAHPRAHAPSGIGPRFQCGDSCDPNGGGGNPPPPPTITCTITVNTPAVVGGSPKAVVATAETDCTSPVDHITMSEDLTVPSGQVLVDQDSPPNATRATTGITTSCAAGQYTNAAAAFIDFPPGYVIIVGSNPLHQFVSIDVAAGSCSSSGGGGGGGGGGCAVHAPNLSTHPAGRHPDFISCS